MPNLTDELYRKALDQLATLLAEKDSGRISPEAFEVGVETIWACLGGVLDTDDFRELMHDANREVRNLKIGPRIGLLSNGGVKLLVMRKGDRVGMQKLFSNAPMSVREHDVDDDAIDYFNALTAGAMARGFQEADL